MGLEDAIVFTSLGMLILDDVYLPSRETLKDVVGGSGAYACFGARLFSPKHLSKQVGYTVRKGFDFPPQALSQIESWSMRLSYIQENDHSSTRGELRYLDLTLSTKSFKYLTEPLPIEPSHLCHSPLLRSDTFHFFLDPAQIREQTAQIQELRQLAGLKSSPIFIWEPKAYSCVSENLQDFIQSVRTVHVFSPNHIELAKIVGIEIPAALDQSFFEELCAPFKDAHLEASERGAIVVRAGDQGCFINGRHCHMWLPAYYTPPENGESVSHQRVVDTTGAGNAFLGAFAVGFAQSGGDMAIAACAGNVAASFVVEQVGMPTLTFADDGKEFWNGEECLTRFQAFRARVDHC